MSRVYRLVAALALTFMAYAFQAVYLPDRAFACTCAEPPRELAEIRDLDQVTIVAGVVGAELADRTAIGVEAWFHGPFATDVVWLMGGANSSTSCDIAISAGERRLLILYGGPRAPGANGLYSTSLCAPGGVIGQPDGDALLAEAAALFGPAQALPSPEPAPQAPIDLSPWLGDGLLWAAFACAVGLAFLGVVILIARRRPTA